MKTALISLLLLASTAFADPPRTVMDDPATKFITQPIGFWAAQHLDAAFRDAVRGSQTNAAGGGSGGAVDSVNGHVGTVVLIYTDVGAQPLSANLTSWSALAPSAKQDHSSNLDSWSALATSAKQSGPLTGDGTTSGTALTLKNTGTAGQYTKVTFDAQGRETSGTTLAAGDIPDLSGSYIARNNGLGTNLTLSDTLNTVTLTFLPTGGGGVTRTIVNNPSGFSLGVSKLFAGDFQGSSIIGTSANISGEVDLTGTTNYIAGNMQFSGGIYTPTNMTATANFNRPMSLTNIGAAFTIAGPINVDGTKTMGQCCIWQITNNTAAAVLVTAPANVHTYWFGTNCTGFYVTNYCSVLFQQYGGVITNAAVAFGW